MNLALVLGGASSVWRDAEEAFDLFEPHAVFAVNDIGAEWPGALAGWVSLHPEKMAEWRDKRCQNGHPQALEHIGHELNHSGIDRAAEYLWPGMNTSGSSGLFAVKVAFEAGFDRVVLAGVPMEPAGAHFFDTDEWHECRAFTEAWHIALPWIAGKVRSMSGWTMELLGAPSTKWLAGDPQPHRAG